MKHVTISGESYTLNFSGAWWCYKRDNSSYGSYCHSKSAFDSFTKLTEMKSRHPHLNIKLIARKKKRFIRLTEYVGRFFGRFKK